jgi:hypothetical protein
MQTVFDRKNFEEFHRGEQRTNQWTNRTNLPTDQPTNQCTDKVFYRGATLRLKFKGKVLGYWLKMIFDVN